MAEITAKHTVKRMCLSVSMIMIYMLLCMNSITNQCLYDFSLYVTGLTQTIT